MILFLWPFKILILSISLDIDFPTFRIDTTDPLISFLFAHILCVLCSNFPTPPNTIKWQKMSYLGKLKCSLFAYFQGTVCILNICLNIFQIIFALYNINCKANWKYILKASYSFMIMLTEEF